MALESLRAIREKKIEVDHEWREWWLENHDLLDNDDWWKKPALTGVPRMNEPGQWSGETPSTIELDTAISSLENK